MAEEKKDVQKVKLSDWKALFTDKLWAMDLDFASNAWKKFVHFFKLVRLTIDSFAQNKMGYQCLALSYMVTLAIVPFIAFIFFVSNGLNVADKVAELLLNAFPGHLELVNLAIEKANNIIHIAQSGTVGFVSTLMFVWSLLWLMFQTEKIFNNVWGISHIPRNIFKRFGFYIGLLILLPFIVVMLSYGIVLYSNAPSLVGLDLTLLHRFFGWVMFYGFTVLTLFAAYEYIPACKVYVRHALSSAAFTGLVFVVFQYLYLETQMFVTKLNAVYGVIAAIPLFLIWLKYSFQIIIYGAELTYALQNVDEYKL